MAGRAREGPLAGAFQIDVVLMRHLQKRQSDRRVHLVPGTVRVYEGDLRHMDQQTPYPLDNPAVFYPRSGPGARGVRIFPSRPRAVFNSRADRSTSAAVVVRPKLTRMVASASSAESPIAVSTWEGSRWAELQAAPVETDRSGTASISSSARMPAKVRLRMDGRCGDLSPFTRTGPRMSRNRCRSAQSRAVSPSRRPAADSAAAPKPTANVVGTVPGRSPRCRPQIGRAPCRERVCQYVSNSVGA